MAKWLSLVTLASILQDYTLAMSRSSASHWSPARYNYSRRDLIRDGNGSFTSRFGKELVTTIPMVLEWAIRDNGSCQPPAVDGGKASASAFVSAHSYCINAAHGPGYLCNCSQGYMGNPYISYGWTDINECEPKYQKQYPCASGSSCHNTEGNYTCECKFGHRGDGKSHEGCQPIFPGYAIAIVATFVSFVLACIAIMLLVRRKQRKLFNKNGGDILKGVGINIFTKGELKTITKRYSNRIGGGFFGDVFMGTIDGAESSQQVAVKCTVAKKLARHRQKTLRQEAPQHEQEEFWKDGFVKEITFQFQIKHPNVVRLIGCCLETDVPILVYEFVPNGSLHDVLHGGEKPCTLSLQNCLDIAIGSADALSYMHTHGDYKHVHGDVKPANILLGDKLMPKISDFGSSKLLSGSRYVKDVASDGAYADTAYHQTGYFTVKSDVYSFGVVLLELITRKTAVYVGKDGKNKSLPLNFVKCFKD